MQTIPPQVAGFFYPGKMEETTAMLTQFFDNVTAQQTACPKAIIAPHAGYVYSGQTAAHAYATLSAYADTIKRVVMFGPAHRYPVMGIATTCYDEMQCSTGKVSIDQHALQPVIDGRHVNVIDQAFKGEHCLEVQLPFLQRVLKHFTLLPFLVGQASHQAVADVLESLWGGAETLIVISSDLSHYLSYENAQQHDQSTLNYILQLDNEQLDDNSACGRVAIGGLILQAKKHHLQPKLLNHCNSGDTAGDKNRVVGYAAVHFINT